MLRSKMFRDFSADSRHVILLSNLLASYIPEDELKITQVKTVINVFITRFSVSLDQEDVNCLKKHGRLRMRSVFLPMKLLHTIAYTCTCINFASCHVQSIEITPQVNNNTRTGIGLPRDLTLLTRARAPVLAVPLNTCH